MARFLLQVKKIDEAGSDHHFDLAGEWLREALTDTPYKPAADQAHGSAELRASRSGSDIIVHGHAHATLTAPCDRCLDPVLLQLNAQISLLLSPLGDQRVPQPEELELTPEDLDRDFYSGEEIQLDSPIREGLLLEVPMQVHCEKQDCLAHIREPSEAPEESSVDPRFAALQGLDLKADDEEPKEKG